MCLGSEECEYYIGLLEHGIHTEADAERARDTLGYAEAAEFLQKVVGQTLSTRDKFRIKVLKDALEFYELKQKGLPALKVVEGGNNVPS